MQIFLLGEMNMEWMVQEDMAVYCWSILFWGIGKKELFSDKHHRTQNNFVKAHFLHKEFINSPILVV